MNKSHASLLVMAGLAAAAAFSPASVVVGRFPHASATDGTVRTAGSTPASPVHHKQPGSQFASGAWGRLRGNRQRRSGPGWTNAHAQRVASKKRRIKAHRARA